MRFVKIDLFCLDFQFWQSKLMIELIIDYRDKMDVSTPLRYFDNAKYHFYLQFVLAIGANSLLIMNLQRPT